MARLALLVVLSLAVRLAPGCGGTTYTGTGDVNAVDAAALRVTMSHDEIPGLMGAMTMTFPVRSAAVLAGVEAGTRVRFALVRDGNMLVVTRMERIGSATGGRPGFHDHTPHHGGVVAMIGMRHLEAAVAQDGRVRVYVTDVWRRPLPLAGTTGTATLELPDGRREVPLVARDDALEGIGPPLAGTEVAARVRVVQDGEALESRFIIPLGAATTGAAGVPLDGCVPPSARAASGRAPRCTLTFAAPVTFIATAPGRSAAYVAVAGTGVSAWHVPDGRFLLGFAPPPAIAVPAEATPHADAANAIAVSPDAREVVVAIENRLPVYATATGQVARELPGLHGVIRSVAWSPDGASVLVTLFYDAAAHLLGAADGREHARLPVEREGAAVAFAPDGKLAAVGSELGQVAIFDVGGEGSPRVLQGSERAIEALAFAGDRLLAAGADGAFSVWDVASGTAVARAELGTRLLRLAVAPGGRLAAVAGLDRTVRLHDVATGRLVEQLAWHEAAVSGLGWVGTLLVSGDVQGRVALWELADRLAPP